MLSNMNRIETNATCAVSVMNTPLSDTILETFFVQREDAAVPTETVLFRSNLVSCVSAE